jgi:hypothetical protein
MTKLNKPLIAPFAAILLTATLLGSLCNAARAVDAQTAPKVVINEFMANNEATVQSPSGNYSDWIELYNPSDTSVDLSSMFLTNNLTDLKWAFTTGTVIEPHGYLLAWADNNFRLGSLHTSFKLDSTGGAIGLISSDGITLVDSVTYGKQIQDISFGRTPDGSSQWDYLSNATPGEANAGVSEFFNGYPWQLWAIVSATIGVVIWVVFKDRVYGRGKQT